MLKCNCLCGLHVPAHIPCLESSIKVTQASSAKKNSTAPPLHHDVTYFYIKSQASLDFDNFEPCYTLMYCQNNYSRPLGTLGLGTGELCTCWLGQASRADSANSSSSRRLLIPVSGLKDVLWGTCAQSFYLTNLSLF